MIGRWVADCWRCHGDGFLAAGRDEDECECPQCDGIGKIEVVRASDHLQVMDAGAVLYEALRDGYSLGDKPAHTAMADWEAIANA